MTVFTRRLKGCVVLCYSVLGEIFNCKHRWFEMDEQAVDERVTLRVREAIQESQQQIMQQMNSLFNKISDQHSISNEQNLLQISSIVATGDVPKFKRKSNEEQYKMNSKVMLKLDEAEQMADSNAAKSKEKIIEGKNFIHYAESIS